MNSTDILGLIWEANTSIAAMFSVYYLLFKRLSFFHWNRIILVFIPIIGLCIASAHIELKGFDKSQSLESVFSLSQLKPFEVAEVTEQVVFSHQPMWWTNLPWEYLLLSIMLFIALLLLIQWTIQFTALKSSLNKTSKLQQELGVYTSDRFDSAFVFLGKIYVPTTYLKLPEQDLQAILAHERAHVHCIHDIDRMMLAIFKALFWYNPIIWILDRELRLIHEYQADSICHNHITPTEYTQLLLKLSAKNPTVPFTQHFSKNLIKKRVLKLNQLKSTNMKKVYYLSAIPVIAMLIYSFSIEHTQHMESQVYSSNSEDPTFILPMKLTSITSFTPYGMRKNPINHARKKHKGIDLVAPLGTEVFAAQSGVVKTAQSNTDGYGKHIDIAHAAGFVSRYAHLKEYVVKQGQHIKQGDLIGYCGTSGLSTGPHLHFEILQNDTPVDPEEYVKVVINNRKIHREELTIIIDPGHGGKDEGVSENGLIEKELCLDYAKALSESLESHGFKVVQTRNSDDFQTLQQRVGFDSETESTIFLSLHFNHEPSGNRHGLEIFTPLDSLEHARESAILANTMLASFKLSGLESNGIKQANYFVLSNAKSPALILELGFISSEDDRKQIKSHDYQSSIVNSITKALESYAQ